MGPLRRGLILALLPAPAMADVCEQLRPMWSPDKGTVNIWTEAAYVFANPMLFVMLLIVLMGSFYRHIAWQMAGIISASFVLLLVSTRLWAKDPNGIWALGQAEGCIAPPIVPTVFAAGVMLFALIRAVRRIRNRRKT